MKKVIVSTLAAAVLALAATSCVTTVPYAVTSNTIGSKVGEATTTYLFGFPIPFDQGENGGTAAAAKAGEITKVATVDVKTYNLLNLIVKKTIVVTGE